MEPVWRSQLQGSITDISVLTVRHFRAQSSSNVVGCHDPVVHVAYASFFVMIACKCCACQKHPVQAALTKGEKQDTTYCHIARFRGTRHRDLDALAGVLLVSTGQLACVAKFEANLLSQRHN
eukprot:4062083-Amphidinium_carterae.1